jgi:hypothetical protein
LARDTLQYGETPLVTQFEKQFESVQQYNQACTRAVVLAKSPFYH